MMATTLYIYLLGGIFHRKEFDMTQSLVKVLISDIKDLNKIVINAGSAPSAYCAFFMQFVCFQSSMYRSVS